ncbi:MAG: serine/threonine protein kinase, partial [Clostridia bacterium]|nr:serine/threonine protein kinase [Clostridia bacterium]
SETFVWPLFLTEKNDSEFGYVMDLLPSSYKCFTGFLLTKEKFASISVVVNAALNITNAFRELHRSGFSYQDLNDGNFFIEPKTGDVLICDTDNVAPYGEALGIAGKARYMAPEVVRNISAPDVMTDRFSLAVILFRLLFLDHPLEGKRTLCPCLTEKLEQKFYGVSPLFIYDPNDNSNAPVRGVHCNVIRLWKFYPKFIKDKFIYSFSQECLQGSQRRLTDNDWQIAFTRLRDCIITCPCGSETFIDLKADSSVCINCGRSIPKPPVLKSKKYAAALFPGNKLYRCHTEEDNDDYTQPTASVVRSKNRPDVWGLRNLSDNTWNVTLKDGKSAEVPKGKVQIIVNAKSIDFGDCIGELEF